MEILTASQENTPISVTNSRFVKRLEFQNRKHIQTLRNLSYSISISTFTEVVVSPVVDLTEL